MSEKRKDNKGRILQTGESQRKDLTYQYRFQNKLGKRITIYAPTLKELREKEAEINQQMAAAKDYSRGNISILEAMKRYLAVNQKIKTNTRVYYESALNQFAKYPFSSTIIADVKKTDVKLWVIATYNQGVTFSSINKMLTLMRPALELAVDDDVIPKNPSRFNLSDVIQKKKSEREALTVDQQAKWLEFIKNDRYCRYNYDTMVILLGTGMRISEYCGLTLNDIDFENRRISVNHQLFKKNRSKYFVETPKSEKSVRQIPMTDAVYKSFENLVNNKLRSKVEMIVDGYHGFIVLNRKGNPQSSYNIDYAFQTAMKRFREKYPDYVMPKITPHVLRHTYCTNLINAGVGVKSVQYLMGHASASITLDRYSHNNYEQANKELVLYGLISCV